MGGLEVDSRRVVVLCAVNCGGAMPDLVDRLANKVASRLENLVSMSPTAGWSALFLKLPTSERCAAKRADLSKEA
jgi:hypothetical protein